MAKRPGHRGRRDHSRSERVGELLREILAGQLDGFDDDRLTNVSITGVDVDNELMKAVVFYDALDDEDIEDAGEALDEHRKELRRSIGDQARLRRIPDLEFRPDRAIREGNRIEEILAGLDLGSAEDDEDTEDAGSDGGSTPPA